MNGGSLMNKKHIPNLITKTRFLFSLLMLYFAYYGRENLFIVFYISAILTDVADGNFARNFDSVSKKGARLDAVADEFMLFSLLASIYFLKPSMIFENLWLLIFIAVVYFITRILVYFRQGKIDKVPMSLYLSKFNLAFINLGTVFVFITNKFHLVKYGLYFLIFTSTLCRIEEVMIHYLHKEVPFDIHSVFLFEKKEN